MEMIRGGWEGGDGGRAQVQYHEGLFVNAQYIYYLLVLVDIEAN